MPKKFVLSIGIHRGTLTSRDTETPKEFDTEQEAIKELDKARSWYRCFGYKIWFAVLQAPDGTQREIESNPYE